MFLVFLEDGVTFSPVEGATVLAQDYSAQYDLAKLMRLVPLRILAECRLPSVNPASVDSANEGLE